MSMKRGLSFVVALVVTVVCPLFGTTACGRGLPDPVVKANGIATIPIDGLLFVIPEKTWLKGYSRNSTDGLVHGFDLHAAAPKVEPWSPARNDQMYKVPGWGNRIEVRVSSNDGRPFIKQTQELKEKVYLGCRFQVSTMHKSKNVLFCETAYEKLFGLVENGVFRYQISCDSDKVKAAEKVLTDPECRIYFFYKSTLSVTIVFAERYFKHGFDMARTIEDRLTEFDKTDIKQPDNRKEEGK